MKELSIIQRALRAPKDQRNNFGKFMYRKASDILQAVKPLLAEQDMSIVLDDDIMEIGGRLFLCSTVSLLGSDGNEIRSTQGYAELDKHAGMSAEQAVGAASSYARKYALCGLFAIDDSTDDPDGIEPKHAQAAQVSNEHTPKEDNFVVPALSINNALQEVNAAQTMDALVAVWKKYNAFQSNATFSAAKDKRKAEIQRIIDENNVK